MKTKNLPGAIFLLCIVQIHFSCKKDISCEGCKEENKHPVANAGPNQTIYLPMNTATLDGSASTDPDNNITTYIWTKISGPSSSSINNPGAAQSQATNLVEGIYEFELRVTDAKGLFSKDTTQITVLNQPIICNDCKIVFVSGRDGNPEIYSCNSDGSKINRLTYDEARDDEPVWSPDHSKIAFISNRSGVNELYIMNSDGSDVVRKTFSGAENPAWSPDGTKIAYATLNKGSSNIWIIDTKSGTSALLFGAPGWDAQPAWSADGNRVAIVSDWAAYDFVYDIYIIKPGGSGFTALTGNIFDRLDYLYPSWSPAGAKIAMLIQERTHVDQYIAQLGVMNYDGSSFKVLTAAVAPNTRTCWSPDGSKIAYTSLSGSTMDVSWVSANGSSSGIIVTNAWNANW